MKEAMFRLCRARTLLQWLRIYRLYRQAFPDNERKPFGIILSMHRRGKTDVWYCETGGRFAGLATTINEEKLILLDYLAVAPEQRGQGVGTRMMHALMENYGGRGMFVEIESPFEDVPDREARLRRKRFYMRCGMQPAGVMADVFGVKMELLCRNCSVDFPRYHGFYRDNYSAWAADHILPAPYPEKECHI